MGLIAEIVKLLFGPLPPPSENERPQRKPSRGRPAVVGPRRAASVVIGGPDVRPPPSEIERPQTPPSPGRLSVVGPRRAASVVIGPDARPYWQIRGWRKHGKTLTGAYRTPRGSFVGKIEMKWGQVSFLILNPPAEILDGPHGACFRPREQGWYWVHFGKVSSDIDSGLVAIEVLIHEALLGHT